MPVQKLPLTKAEIDYLRKNGRTVFKVTEMPEGMFSYLFVFGISADGKKIEVEIPKHYHHNSKDVVESPSAFYRFVGTLKPDVLEVVEQTLVGLRLKIGNHILSLLDERKIKAGDKWEQSI